MSDRITQGRETSQTKPNLKNNRMGKGKAQENPNRQYQDSDNDTHEHGKGKAIEKPTMNNDE